MHAWYSHAVMHAASSIRTLGADRPSPGRLLPFLALLVVAVALVGCRGPRAARYQRMRQSFDASYRVGLLRPASPLPGLPSSLQRPLVDDFLADLRRQPRLRVTDPDTVEAHLRQQGQQAPPASMDPSALEALGEGLDLEAFVVPVGLPAARAGEATLQLRLVNGYTGNVLWRAQTPVTPAASQEAWAEAFRLLVTQLMERLENLASVQALLRSSPEPALSAPSAGDLAPTVPPSPSLPPAFPVPPQGDDAIAPHVPVAPGWDAGAEQLALDLPPLRRLDPVPAQGPLATVVLRYGADPAAPPLTLILLDEREPGAARRRLEDLFAGASPQVVDGCRTFALRDPADGSLAAGLLLGRFVAQIRAAAGAEAQVAGLTQALVEANEPVLAFYRAHPRPPAPPSRPAPPAPATVVREIHDVRTVEVPRTVVPTVQILLDGRRLGLVRDDGLSTPERLVLTLAPEAAPAVPPSPAPAPTASSAVAAPTTPPVPAPPPPSPTPHPSPAPLPATPPPTPQGPDPTATTVPAARIRFDLGQRYLAASRFDAAEEEFRRALTLDPLYEAPRSELRRMRDTYGLAIAVPEPPPPPPPTPPPTPTLRPSPPRAATRPVGPTPSAPPPPPTGASGTWLVVTVLVVLGGMLALVLLPRGGRRGR